MAPFLRGSTWTQVLLGGSLWLSVLWVLLCPVCCSQGPPKWRFTTSEVVIPRKVPQRMGGSDRPDQLAYSMRFRGQRHVVHMKLKKNMIPENLPVYTTNDQGAEQEDYPFVPRDCYFYSYLEGVPGSLATLDTCNGGLNGMLQVDDFTYEIKPLASSSKFEHVISLLVVEEGFRKSKKCTNEENVVEADEFLEEMQLAGSPRAAPVYLWRVHTKLVRMYYTITVEVTRNIQNYTASLEFILIMNNIADSIYKEAGLRVYPYVIEIWESHNGLDINQWQNNPQQILSNFGTFKMNRYKNKGMSPTTYAILAGLQYGGVDYAAMQNQACSKSKGVVYVHVVNMHKFLSTALLCHALGHSLGLHHDTPGCVCFRRSSCVMNEFPALMDMMSNCSQADLHTIVTKVDNCLSFPRTQFYRQVYEVPRCGDNKVNSNEQCDCGPLKECINNSCCATNCRFTSGSSCDVGGCCQQCSFAPAGTMCRDKLGICDLPEYCDGNSQNCPQNFYIQDGTPCSPLAVCMSGNCSDRDLQCQALFGYQVKDAKPACYKQLNMKGDRFGNCGLKVFRTGTRFHACQDDDIFCGLLHCDGVIRVPGGGEHTTFHHIRIQDIQEEHCFGYDVHHGADIPSMGLVVDGATCGPGKYCRRQSCVFHQNLNFTCDVTACNHRGVCNNRGHCHCVRGWQPPNCEEEGSGGSADSGPVPTSEEMLQAKIRVNINKILVVLCTRMILVLASLFFGGISKVVIVLDSRRKAYQA
ncbi:disintegrin and metalloproteinase domain-containing protein 21-like [Peromyscus eremicus]|uniref:disintegrin and metalloproteinase domain-containing protein 21-like n=1 Tax=Peromyscus eremicus TaxID=42410 RepID=UPI0027DD71C0|nr:disintegrin and metalloproteinase domain-containing protein 21-like [Peromyscus eremicus]